MITREKAIELLNEFENHDGKLVDFCKSKKLSYSSIRKWFSRLKKELQKCDNPIVTKRVKNSVISQKSANNRTTKAVYVPNIQEIIERFGISEVEFNIVEEYFKCKVKTKAYQEHHPSCSHNSAKSASARMFANVNVKNYLEFRKEEIRVKNQIEIDMIFDEMKTCL